MNTPTRMEQRIDLRNLYATVHTNEGLIGFEEFDVIMQELKRMYEKEDLVIEYVGYLLATPGVLEQMMGSPSQIHTINNLTGSLENLLDILKDNASE